MSLIYSVSDIKTAVDDANGLLKSGGKTIELTYDLSYNMVRIQSIDKENGKVSLVLGYSSIKEAYFFLQGLNTAAMALDERANKYSYNDSDTIKPALSSNSTFISKIKCLFKNIKI
jgi:hypothetical protein